ncbi:hypothetical protein D9M71_632730 [compost metagenome]
MQGGVEHELEMLQALPRQGFDFLGAEAGAAQPELGGRLGQVGQRGVVDQWIAQDVPTLDDGAEALQQFGHADRHHIPGHQVARIELRPVAIAIEDADVIAFMPVIEATQVVHDFQFDFRMQAPVLAQPWQQPARGE